MLGIDVVEIDRLRAAMARSPKLAARLFTEPERAYCRSFVEPLPRFAGTLAAKEAVIKAARLGSLMAWARRVEIRRDSDGVPSARVTRGGDADEVAVSISHDGPVAVAVALAQPHA